MAFILGAFMLVAELVAHGGIHRGAGKGAKAGNCATQGRYPMVRAPEAHYQWKLTTSWLAGS
jgi:hypothetical protein